MGLVHDRRVRLGGAGPLTGEGTGKGGWGGPRQEGTGKGR